MCIQLENAYPAERHREQARSYSWIEYIWQELVGCQAAIASKLCSYEKHKQDQKIAACGSSYTG